MKKMHWMLISVADREIMTEQFETFEEAHNQMIKEFCEYGQIDPANCTEEEFECDSEFGYCKWTAYITDGVNHEDYDWLIVGLD